MKLETQLREEVIALHDFFVGWYNEEHLHSEISYVTPGSKHRGEDREILEQRRRIYEEAKERRPDRWSNKIGKWSFIKEVSLNPLKDKNQSDTQIAA